MTPVGIAVIGAGTIADAVHLPALRRLRESFCVRAVCDLSATRAEFVAERLGADVRATTDAAAAIDAPGVEAVLLATSGAHGQLADLALGAGRHVLAEKPLSFSLAETLALQRRAEEQGVVLQVGYMKMYDPVVRPAAEAIARIRRRRLVRITVLHPDESHQLAHLRPVRVSDVDPDVVAAAGEHDLRQSEIALGATSPWLANFYREVLCGSLSHELSLLRALGFPLPTHFDAAEVYGGDSPAGDAPCIQALARLDADTRVNLSWNFLPDYPNYDEELAVFGDDGRVYVQMAPPYLLDARSTLVAEGAAGETRESRRVFGSYESGFLVQLESFAAAIQKGEPVLSDAAGAAQDVRCMLALSAAVARAQGIEIGGEATGGLQ